MKKVAGTIRINLANYRELESFAQFGSDLDSSAKRRLERGRKTVELLKQDVHELIDMPTQIVTIYALSNGFMDDIDTNQVQKFEQQIALGLNNDPQGIKIKEVLLKTKALPDKETVETFIKSRKKVL
jgi:F-type H+-transporting ATPase subunit alpha